jgi:hypothetical protein
MTDTREAILTRLETVLGNITGITAVYRDRGEMPIEKLPAAILLDGSEIIAQQITPNKSVRMPPAIFTLVPQIFIVLKPRDDMTNTTLDGVEAPIGPEISAYRLQVIDAIVNDSELLSLVGSNGQILYRGADTDMQSGSSMVGQLQMHFDFNYVFVPPRG